MSLQVGDTALSHQGSFNPETTGLAELPPVPDTCTLAEGFAEHLRLLLRTNLVSIFLSDVGTVRLHAISAASTQLANLVRSSYRSHGLQFASDLVRRASLAGETIAATIDPATHGLGDAIPPGMLLVGPFRTSQAHGAIVVYPRAEGAFSRQERSFLPASCGFLASAMANAEMYASARRRLGDLQQVVQVPERRIRGSDLHDQTFDAIPDYIVVHDDADKISRVNRALADFIGVQPQELIGVAMPALFAMGNDLPEPSCPICRTVASDPSREHTIPLLDRTYLVSTSRLQLRDTPNGQIVHVLKDITDRQDAERRYRELFESIQEGIFFAVPEGRFIEVNDALVRILGYAAREDLLQAHIRNQLCSSPEHYDDFVNEIRKHGAVHNYEQILRRADGTLIDVLVNAFAVRDRHQNVIQFRGAIQDIHSLKLSQSELHRERDFSSKILDNTQSLILVAGTDGQVTYANRRWYQMGYQPHQLLGRPLQQLIAPSSREAFSQAIAATLAGQQIDNLELQIARAPGRIGHFAANLSPVRDEHGNVGSIVVVMSDITDSATLQSKLHARRENGRRRPIGFRRGP